MTGNAEERWGCRAGESLGSIVELAPTVVPPLDEPGQLYAPSTLLIDPSEGFDVIGSSLVGDVFENVTLFFELDPVGGASGVDNEDNWGIGAAGLDVQKLWDAGIRGQGVRVGIADSGMDSTHPTFLGLTNGGRLKAFAHFDKQGQKDVQKAADGSPLDDSQAVPTFGHWHGTHCAAIVAGEPTDGKARGIAPEVELVIARVLEEANEGSVSGIAAGLWWLTTQNCDIVSLSLGWPGLHEEWASPVLALLAAGVVVVAAVGNEFLSAGVPKTRSPGNYLGSPSDDSGIHVSVGAHDQGGAVWDMSGGGVVDWSKETVRQADGTSKPSVFAAMPPTTVPVLVAPGADVISAAPGNQYMSSSGSSMATPHIAGLIALVLAKLRSQVPTSRPADAAKLVLSSLHDIPPAGVDIRSGGGRVDPDLLMTNLSQATNP